MVNDWVRPMDDYPQLIEEALEVLRKPLDTTSTINPYSRDSPKRQREAALNLIEEASFEALPALHPHLDELFRLEDVGSYPWRESNLLHFNFLTRIINDESSSEEERWSAGNALRETRHPLAFDFVERTIDTSRFNYDWLELVGYHKRGNLYVPLYTEDPLHIIFPPEYQAQITPDWKTQHPTWHLPPTDEASYRFGGMDDAECAVCGRKIHHLITLDPIPQRLNIIDLTALTLSVCLNCLGWNWDTYHYLYYEHDQAGHPHSTGYDDERIEPEFPDQAIQETRVQLADGGPRWRWRDWGSSNNHNLHRVGGFPAFVQGEDYPLCVRCEQPMRFLIQLNSGLPREGGGERVWGVWGMGYGFWCDNCHISTYLLQHT